MGLFDRLFGGKADDYQLREARFSGMMYPDEADELRGRIEGLMAGAPAPPVERMPEAIIAPHAEYAFAGPTMAAAYAALVAPEAIERIVLVGSSRLVPFRGLAVTGYDGFETPLGPALIDRERLGQVARRASVRAMEPVFDPEASLEVQLPFLQVVLDRFALVPLIVGDADSDEVAEVLGPFFDEEQTLVVVAANMSDDVTAERAAALDDELQAAIEGLDDEVIGRDHSYARVALQGLLRAAGERGLAAHTLDRRTSAQVEGGTDEAVTGYGAFALYA